MEKNIKNIVMRKQKKGFGKRWKTGRMRDSSKTAAGMPDQDFKFQTLSSGDGEKKKTKHGKRQVNISLKLLLTYLLGSNPYFGL